MTRLHLLIFVFIGFAVTFCTSKSDAPEKKPGKVYVKETMHPYAGSVFFFAPKLDKSTCEVYGDCECCWDNILFIDDYRFIRIYYCEADRNYRRGTYSIKNDSIFLIYSSIELEQEVNWDFDDETLWDTAVPAGVTFRTEPLEELMDTLAPVMCKENRRLKTGTEGDYYYGQPDIIKPLKQYLKEIKDDSIAIKLELNL